MQLPGCAFLGALEMLRKMVGLQVKEEAIFGLFSHK